MKNSLVLLFVVFLSSCIGRESDERFEEKVIGEYHFEFPSKELAVITIEKDSIFTHQIFTDKAAFENKLSPQFSSVGRWFRDVDHNEIYFENWLLYCEGRNPNNTVSKARKITMFDVYWGKNSNYPKGYLSVYLDYAFIKQ